jgi:proline iminopeptidase
MKRILIIAVVLLIGIGTAGYLLLRHFMTQPLYEPGMVNDFPESVLQPPTQTEVDFWLMTDQVKLFRFAKGEGRNVLIVHGGPGFPITEPLSGLEPLLSSFRFHYYDQRGCGQSSRPVDRFASSSFYKNVKQLEQILGLSAQVADIERIRRILGEKRVILIGHSFGAFIASLYAAEFPDRVAAMILIAPADVLIFPQKQGGLFEEIKTRLPQSMMSDYEAYLKRYFDFNDIFSKDEASLAALNAELIRYYQAAVESKEYRLPLDNLQNNGGWMVQAMYFSMGLEHDYTPALRQVTAPVLVIHGSDDLQSETASRTYAEVFPQSTFKSIAKADHFVFNEPTGVFSKTVTEFLLPFAHP